MGSKDPRIDAYIARSADFAKPILKHLRKIVHAGCPKVEETLKWSMPHFDYRGVMCGMKKNAKAHKTFESFPPSKRREYLEWVTEAEREETRGERLATSVKWLAGGKPRHWKYMPAKK
jgi:uncharacterized protein YdeI (YjbR/CyaY-like superfamily)